MILLRSNAHHIYWLGRYLCRVDYFAKQLSSIEKQQKENSIQFFGLHFDDIQQLNEFMLDRQHPNSLISLLEKVIDNIHALRAVLGSDCYAQLNNLIKTTEIEISAIQTVAVQCHELLATEQDDFGLFLQLGHFVEQLDQQFRSSSQQIFELDQMNLSVERLSNFGWNDLPKSWVNLKQQPTLNHFYRFTQKLEHLFEEVA